VNPERQVRLFRNGRNQALRIPRDLELPGQVTTLRKGGGSPDRRARGCSFTPGSARDAQADRREDAADSTA
jgi:hypothetical protein